MYCTLKHLLQERLYFQNKFFAVLFYYFNVIEYSNIDNYWHWTQTGL